MDTSNSIEIKMSIVNALGTVFFLEAGFGMSGLAINALLNALVSLAVTVFTLKRSMDKISFGWNFDSKLLREMFSYGAKITVSRFAFKPTSSLCLESLVWRRSRSTR